MFRCQLCSRVAPPRTPRRQLVVARRPRRYPVRARANLVWPKKRKPEDRYTDDPGGIGRETVREVAVCPGCAARHGAA